MHRGCLTGKIMHHLRRRELTDCQPQLLVKHVVCYRHVYTLHAHARASTAAGTCFSRGLPAKIRDYGKPDAKTSSHLDKVENTPSRACRDAGSSSGSSCLPTYLHQHPAQEQSKPCLAPRSSCKNSFPGRLGRGKLQSSPALPSTPSQNTC